MTRDCDQSQRVFLQNITLTCWLTLSLFLFIFIIIYILYRDLNYIHHTVLNKFIKTHLCKVFNKLCKVCATSALN